MWDTTWDLLQHQPWIHNVIQAKPYNNFQLLALKLDVCNRLSVQPYAYSQHNNVLKHYIYISYGSDMQSVMVYSLNHETMIPFLILILPIFILSATPLWCISVTPYPAAYSMLFNVLIHLYMHERWMIMVGFVRSGQWQCASITHAAMDQAQTFLTTSLLTYCTYTKDLLQLLISHSIFVHSQWKLDCRHQELYLQDDWTISRNVGPE